MEEPKPARPTRPSLLRRAAVAVVAVLGLALAGCAEDAPQDIFQPEGPEARTINNLQVPVFIAAGVVFVIVGVALLLTILKFRLRKGQENDVPNQLHGNTKLEIGWTILPAVILAGVAVGTVPVIFELAEEPEGALEINVIGQQWWWEFSYPEQGIVTANEIVIPAGEPVIVHITSRDVIHSFWVPKLNGKRDAVPGRVHDLTLEADEPGEWMGHCAEFCGLSHANMRIRARALDREDFDAWVANQQRDAPTPAADTAAAAGLEVFEGRCVSCHQIDGVNEVADVAQVAGAAPNLTHLMDRPTFAGAIFPLWSDEQLGVLEGDRTRLNRAQLEAWLRDPPAEKPMAADQQRGMPNLGLSEEEIDNLVAYLETLE